jgi:hypothetical protein
MDGMDGMDERRGEEDEGKQLAGAARNRVKGRAGGE